MEFVKKIFKFINDKLKEPDLKLVARLSEEDVMFIANLYGKEQGWLPELIPKPPYLEKEWNKLCWTIYFDAEGREHQFSRGGNIFIVIDDQTSKVIRKCVQSR